MDDKSEYYKEEYLKSMIFSYTIKKGRAKDKITFDSINSSLSYQYYHHHKLPITMNPLNYGKLIKQVDNEYIIQINKTNIAIINKYDEVNHIKFYKEGDLIYEYKDHKIDDSTFIRNLGNKKFTFSNNKLVNINTDKRINRPNRLRLINSLNTNLKLGIRRFSTSHKNIIKLRKNRTSNI
jgi:hypothetical protein